MLKSYRRRFVLSAMAPVCVVLLLVFTALAVYLHRENLNTLWMTMAQAVRPWSEPTDIFVPLPEGAGPLEEPPEALPPGAEQRPLTPRPSLTAEGLSLTTVFYDGETGEILFLSEAAELDAERIGEAVRAAAERVEDFGTLPEYGLLYYRERQGGSCKLALAEGSWLTARTLRSCLLLAAIFLGALALFFFICLRLSLRAARPMENALEMERQFVADASHDLKTPITVILANDSILRENPGLSAAERQQWLDSTDEAARGMMRLVEQMLTLSALESPSAAPQTEPVPTNLSSAAEKAALQLESVAWEKGVTLSTELQEGVTVLGTADRLERICSGLIENAVKYEPAGGVVEVTLKAQKRKAVLSVRNRGSFIPPEDQGHVFERFYRSDKARDLQKGHGLGLPIVKRLTELLHGSIELESSEAEGTRFTVRFELAE